MFRHTRTFITKTSPTRRALRGYLAEFRGRKTINANKNESDYGEREKKGYDCARTEMEFNKSSKGTQFTNNKKAAALGL